MALIPCATLFPNAIREDIAVFPVSFCPNGATTVLDATTFNGTTTLVDMAANAANRVNLLVAISRSRTT